MMTGPNQPGKAKPAAGKKAGNANQPAGQANGKKAERKRGNSNTFATQAAIWGVLLNSNRPLSVREIANSLNGEADPSASTVTRYFANPERLNPTMPGYTLQVANVPSVRHIPTAGACPCPAISACGARS